MLTNLKKNDSRQRSEELNLYIDTKERINMRIYTISLISYASKITFRIIQHRLEAYMEREIPDVETGIRKG